MKLLAMAVVADGKKGVCPPTAAETCQTCFASLLLFFSFSLLFLSPSLVSRLSSVLAWSGHYARTFQDLAACCGYTSDADSRHLFKSHAMHTNITDMLKEMALIALLCHARSLPQHSQKVCTDEPIYFSGNSHGASRGSADCSWPRRASGTAVDLRSSVLYYMVQSNAIAPSSLTETGDFPRTEDRVLVVVWCESDV